MKINRHIEIVASSSLRLSAMTPEAQMTVLAVLQKHYTKVAITIVDTMDDLEKLVAKKPDLVVLGMKLVLLDSSKSYDDSPKVWLSDYLKEKNICFTGSTTDALEIEFDKPVAKQKVLDAGLQSSRYFISPIGQQSFEHNLTFPLFVKPTNRGDSKGIDERSVVHTQQELESKIISIHTECQSDVLIEEYLSGREFSVAVMGQGHNSKLLAMPIEIIPPVDRRGNSFLSEAVKDADSERVAAVTDDTLRAALNALAVGVFGALGSRDYGRIDVRLDDQGVPNFIEANLMPGLSDHGYLSRCFFMNESISYEDMVLSIIDLGIKRVRNSIPARPRYSNVRVIQPASF